MRAVALLENGRSLAQSLGQTHALLPMHMGMIATGERSGRLDEMVTRVAENCEYSVKSRTKVLGIIVPVILYLVIIGCIIPLIFKFYLGRLAETNEFLDQL